MNNSAKLTLQWAEKYLSLGWSVIPLKSRSKEPLIPWQEYQTRKASLSDVQKWVKKWPYMNLGIVTGNISSLVVVDLDGAEGKAYGNRLKIVSPCMSLTGNGKQVFYKWTEHVDNSVAKTAPGVDIRGDGGYVVVCPSVHPNGKHYRWERFVPENIPIFDNRIIAPSTVFPQSSVSMLTLEPKGKPDGWIAKALEEMKIGNIDDTLTSILGRLRHDGYSDSDCLRLLEPHAKKAGATNGHLESKIKHIWESYEAKKVRLYPSDEQSRLLPPGELRIHNPADDDSFDKFTESMGTKESGIGLRTGFPTLDRYFESGLKSERLFTVAARTGVGKTNFGIALSSNLCQQGKKVLYFSTEFQYQKVWSRYIATLKNPNEFRGHAFHVVDSYSPNLSQVEEAIKKVMPDVFIFDFIQHIGKEKEVLTNFMRGCQFLQRQYGTQGIILAQLNRNADWVEGGKRVEPRMSMIEGSSTIEQASSRVLLLSETRVTPEYNEICGVLDKNDTGNKGIINFALMKNPYKFVEL